MIPEEFIKVTNQNSNMPIEFGKKNKQKMGTCRKMGEGGRTLGVPKLISTMA